MVSRDPRPSDTRTLVRDRRASRVVHYGLLLLIHVEMFVPPMGAGRYDWWNFFHPSSDAVRRIILRYGEFPWWNPWAQGGGPLFADPEIAVLSPDTLLTLAFGAVLGPKLAIILYLLLGYEGTRALLRYLFRREVSAGGLAAERMLLWASVLPILTLALTAHLVEGHQSFVSFYLFPWLLLLSLTWRRGVARSLALGAVAGGLLLTYVHYATMMSLTVAGAAALVALVRGARCRRTWALAGLAALTALGCAFTRLAVAVQWMRHCRRAPHFGTDLVALDPRLVIASLFRPFGPRSPLAQIGEPWWMPRTEVACYVGVLAVLAWMLGLRRGGRWRVRWWHVAVPVLFLMAWNNRDAFSPSAWLRHVPPWSFLVFCTRWRLFASFFLLIGAVGGVMAISVGGRRRLAWLLGVLIVLDLAAQTAYRWHGRMKREPPPVVDNPDPPTSVNTRMAGYWPALRRNEVALGAMMPACGWGPRANRPGRDDPGYCGEVHGRDPAHSVTVSAWSPSRWLLHGRPGDWVTLSINAGNYWLANGRRLWPHAPPSAPVLTFRVSMPPSGTLELLARPPHLPAFLAIQAACALLAALLALLVRRRSRRRTGP